MVRRDGMVVLYGRRRALLCRTLARLVLGLDSSRPSCHVLQHYRRFARHSLDGRRRYRDAFFQDAEAATICERGVGFGTASPAAYRLLVAKGDFYDLSFALDLALAFIFLLRLVENWKWIERFEGPITFLAAYSYTLYLTHYTVMSSISFLTGFSRVIVVIISANALAIAMWWLFERHHRAIASALKARLAAQSQSYVMAPRNTNP